MRAKPLRRIITVDDDQGRGTAIEDGPAPDVSEDPARPGIITTHIWTTDSTPARLRKVDLPRALEPPPGGSICRVITVLPDAVWQGQVGGPAPSGNAARPPMQRTRSLDFCLILEGEVTLVLDTEEVHLRAGDTVIQRGSNHAWSNRSNAPCIIAISSHDGA